MVFSEAEQYHSAQRRSTHMYKAVSTQMCSYPYF